MPHLMQVRSRRPAGPRVTDDLISPLRWACRRGMLELDVLLLRYLEHAYLLAPPAEQMAFKQLLTYTDPEIFSFLMGNKQVPDDSLQPLISNIMKK